MALCHHDQVWTIYGYVFIINSAMWFKVDNDDMEPLKYTVSLDFNVAHFKFLAVIQNLMSLDHLMIKEILVQLNKCKEKPTLLQLKRFN